MFRLVPKIDCYAKSKQKGAAEKAELLLEQMIDKSREGRSNVKPNTITVNCVLDALAKSGEKGAAARAENVLSRMENNNAACFDNVQLNTISYTSGKSQSGRAE